MQNELVNRTLNEAVRPLNERLRRQFNNVRDFLLQYDADIAPLLAGLPDGEVIDDGRTDAPIRTVGELRHWILALRAINEVAQYRDAFDNTPTQAALNNVFNTVNVRQTLVKFTVRSGIFGDG